MAYKPQILLPAEGGIGVNTITGLVTGNGTSAMTGTAITKYNVLTGGASNLPNSVAPSATSGIPFISQGSSAQPEFGTAVVAGGGTGETSFTAYTPICGGTSTTGALQSVASIGTATQAFLSNGASALPTFQTVPLGSFTASSQMDFVDDFFYSSSGSVQGPWTFSTNSGAFGINNSDQNYAHPGIITMNTGSSASASPIIQNVGPSVGQVTLGNGIYTLTFYFYLNQLSNGTDTFTLAMGISNDDGTPSGGFGNGIWVNYNSTVNSGNWVYNAMKGGTATNSNSSTAVATGWQVIQIQVNANASSISFLAGTTLANLASLGTAITTNIPTSAGQALGMYFSLTKTAGTTAVGAGIDLITANYQFTTAR
jgi:hypothetical protein